MRRPVQLRGTPVRYSASPAPASNGSSPFEVLAMIDELRRMHNDLMRYVPLVQQALATFESVKEGKPGLPGLPGDPGDSVTQDQVEAAVRQFLRQPKDGIAPTAQEVAEVVLQSPKLFKLITRKLKEAVPQGTDKQEQEQTPAETIIAMVLEGITKNGLDISHVKGLEGRLAEIRNHKATGQWRGGGDTVVAGTGVTITNTSGGNKRISASGGVGTWSTPPEAPNSVRTVFTVGSSAPTDVVADGILLYSGAGYTFAAGQITFTNPPTQYVRYR